MTFECKRMLLKPQVRCSVQLNMNSKYRVTSLEIYRKSKLSEIQSCPMLLLRLNVL